MNKLIYKPGYLFVIAITLCTGIIKTSIAQNTNVELLGKIIDNKTKSPLAGATIHIKGTTHEIITDNNGEFKFVTGQRVPVTYIISYIGYDTKEVLISSYGHTAIELQKGNVQLDDVVVVGYGTQKRKDLIGSVTKIDPSSTKKIPAGSFEAQLQGKAPGVQFTTNTGVPGEVVTVRLRGATSINADNSPLYVVDGVFINSTSVQSINTGGKASSPIADINPSDIESIEILKDAEAAALYGSRGANGVIIVTTKRGNFNQKTQVNFDASHGVAWAPPLWKLTTGPEHATLVNEYFNNIGKPQPFTGTVLNPSAATGRGTPDLQKTYDRLDEIFRKAQLSNYDLSVSGGTKGTKFYIGAGYNKQESILKPITFDRSSFKFNLDQKISDKVQIGISNTLSRTFRNQGRAGDGPAGGILQAALHTPTYLSPYNDQGVLVGRAGFDNVTLLIDNYDVNSISLRYIGNAYLEAEIIKGLKFRSTLGIDYNNYDESEYWNTFLSPGSPAGLATSTLTRNSSWVNEQILSYRKRFSNKHSFGILVGNTIQQNTNKQTALQGTGFANNSYTQISSASAISGSQNWSQNKLSSFFGKADYNFSDRYLIDFSFRADGSSKFPDHKWGYFPAVGAAWRVKQESFLKNVETVNDLKIRASYGILGNQNGIGDFAAKGLWTGGTGYKDSAGIAPLQLASDLRWEQTSQFNIGVDVSFFKSRLNVEFNYYRKYTTDGLLQITPEATSGLATPYWANAAEISNKGFEFSINTLNISNKDFNWTTNFNIAQNINKIEKLVTPSPLQYGSRNLILQKQGYPLYSFNLIKQLSVDPQTGNAIYEDKSNRQIMGSIWPKFFGGISNNLTYKDFDFNIFFSYQYGNKTYNHNRFFGEGGGARDGARIIFASDLARWQKPGDITDVPKADGVNVNNYLDGGSRWLEDGGFLRLRTLTIGYTIPKRITQKARFENVRIYVVGSNLFLVTKYTGPDPESSANSAQNQPGIDLGTPPQPRSVQFGISFSL